MDLTVVHADRVLMLIDFLDAPQLVLPNNGIMLEFYSHKYIIMNEWPIPNSS